MRNKLYIISAIFYISSPAMAFTTYVCKAKWAMDQSNSNYQTVPAIRITLEDANTLVKYEEGKAALLTYQFMSNSSVSRTVVANFNYRPTKHMGYNQFIMNGSISSTSPAWDVLFPKKPTVELFSAFVEGTSGESGGSTEYLCNPYRRAPWIF
jgi:hypothetical protein